MFERIWKLLYGDDIFISYSRADGERYATSLASELVNSEFSCRFDRWGSQPGKKIPTALIRALRRSSLLVLVGSIAASQSKHVSDEIEEFKKFGGVIIPIIFDGALLSREHEYKNGELTKLIDPNLEDSDDPREKVEKALWADSIAGLSMSWETSQALDPAGNARPSVEVIDRIKQSFTFRRKDERLRLMSRITSVVLFILLTASLAAGVFVVVLGQRAVDANERAAEALENANISSKRAENANAQAERAQSAANVAKNTAKRKTDEAEKAGIQAEKARVAALKANSEVKKKNLENAALTREKTELDKQKRRLERETDGLIHQSEVLKSDIAVQKELAARSMYATQILKADSMYREGAVKTFASVLNETPEKFRGFEWNYLNRLRKGLIGFTRPPRGFRAKSLAFSPKGRYLSSVGYDNGDVIMIWSPQTGAQIMSLLLGDNISSVRCEFSRDERWLIASFMKGGNPKLKLWDTSTWQELPTPTGLSFSLWEESVDIAFDRDDSEITILSNSDDTFSIQRLKTGSMRSSGIRKSISPLGSDFRVHGFSADLRLLVSYGTQNRENPNSNPQTQVSLLDLNSSNEEVLISHDAVKLVNRISRDFRWKRYNESQELKYVIAGDRLVRWTITSTQTSKTISDLTIWDTKNPLASLKVLEGRFRAVELSPDGNFLAVKRIPPSQGSFSTPETSSEESGVSIWSIGERNISRVKWLRILDSFSRFLAFAPDSKSLAVAREAVTAGDSNSLTLWSVSKQENVFNFDGEEGVAISNDGSMLLSREPRLGQKRDFELFTLWDTRNRRRIDKIRVLTSDLVSGSFSQNQNYLNLFLEDWNSMRDTNILLKLASIEDTRKKLKEVELDNTCVPSSKLAFSSDEKKGASICKKDATVRIWNLETGEEIKRIETTMQAAMDDPRSSSVEVLFLFDNKKLAVTIGGEIVLEVDTKSGESIHMPKDQLIALSSDGNRLVTRDKEGKYLLKIGEERGWTSFPLPLAAQGHAAFSKSIDKMFLIENSERKSVSVVSLPSMNLVKLERSEHGDDNFGIRIIHSQPNGSWLLNPKGNRIIEYWNLRTGVRNSITGCVGNVAFSEDEKRLFTSCSDGTIWIWDLENGQRLLSIEAHDSLIRAIFPLLGDRALLIQSIDGEVKLWATEF